MAAHRNDLGVVLGENRRSAGFRGQSMQVCSKAPQEAVPMIIVMPNGDIDGSRAGGSSPEGIELLTQELLTDIIPMIEKDYRVAPGRKNRAITAYVWFPTPDVHEWKVWRHALVDRAPRLSK